MDTSMDSFKQYEETLVDCFEKIIKLTPRKSDVLKVEAKKAMDLVKTENQSELDANKYFWIMKLALDLRNNKLMVQVLSSIQKLISHGYMDGD